MNRSTVLLSAIFCALPLLRAQTPAATPATPLPNIPQLLQQVEQNEKANEALRNDYTYHIHFEEVALDKHGQVKKTTTTDSESLTIDGVRVDRLVAKDGKPLTSEEKKKEDGRIDKIVAKAKTRRQALENKGKASNGNGEAMMPASRFLELGTFSNARRVLLNGRPTIVLDYKGDPHAKTRDELEGIVRDLVGTIWVDEADSVMVQAKGHFLKDFKVGFGMLVDIHAGLNFSVTKQKINNEVWLPSEIAGQGSARIFLFLKINGRIDEQMSHYQKFRTGATIIPSYRLVGPNGQILPQPQPPPKP